MNLYKSCYSFYKSSVIIQVILWSMDVKFYEVLHMRYFFWHSYTGIFRRVSLYLSYVVPLFSKLTLVTTLLAHTTDCRTKLVVILVDLNYDNLRNWDLKNDANNTDPTNCMLHVWSYCLVYDAFKCFGKSYLLKKKLYSK